MGQPLEFRGWLRQVVAVGFGPGPRPLRFPLVLQVAGSWRTISCRLRVRPAKRRDELRRAAPTRFGGGRCRRRCWRSRFSERPVPEVGGRGTRSIHPGWRARRARSLPRHRTVPQAASSTHKLRGSFDDHARSQSRRADASGHFRAAACALSKSGRRRRGRRSPQRRSCWIASRACAIGLGTSRF